MGKDSDISIQPETDFESALDEGQSSGNLTIKDLEQIVERMLKTLPRLNRASLRLEMEDMFVNIQENPTTKDLNEGLAKAQGYKDRLSEIYTLALRELKLRSRTMDMLYDAINYVSTAKSADKRKGEATMKYPMLIIQKDAAETFLKEVEHVLQNIKSSHDSISRQITLMQIQLQLGEVRRETSTGNYKPNDAEEYSRKKNSGEMDWDSI